MPYSPQEWRNWRSGGTPTSAARLTHMEEGIKEASDRLDGVEVDSRWADTRTPKTHAASHASGGSDPVTPAAIGALDQATGDARYAQTTDARLSNARTPTAHKASHAAGGADALSPADIGADSLLGSYRHSARALRDRLATNQRCVWAHLGDSTANAPDEWLQLALHQFGGDYPNQRFEHRLWSDANQNFDAASMVQPGMSSGVEPPPIVRDTFTRTAAALSGTAADTGQVWGGGNGTLDGAVYTIGNVAASVVHGIDPNGPDGVIVRGRFTIPSGTTSGNARLFALAYNGTDELFAEIGPSATGLSLNLYQRVGGTATNIGSGVSIALANSADRIADLSLSFKAGQATATLTANGTTVTRSAAVTVPGGWVGYTASARNLVITAPAGYKADDVSAGLNAPDPASLVVYNGSMPGASLAYHQARVAAMLPEAPDLVTIASSHNHGTQSVAAFLAQIDALVSAVLALYPDAGIALVSQNPQFPPANNAAVRAAHSTRIVAVGPHARARGFGYIPGAEPFLGRDDRGQGVVVTDGIHPSATGSGLWRDAGLSYLRGMTDPPPSTTIGASPNLINPATLTTGRLQARLDAAPVGGTVSLGAGTLTLSDRLFVPPGVTLDCAGTTIAVPYGSPIVNEGTIRGARIDVTPGPSLLNLMSDPTFASYPAGSAGWFFTDDAPASLTASRDTSGRGHNGMPALKFVETLAAQSDRVVFNKPMTVTPGLVYTCVAWVETQGFTAAASHGGEARGLWFQTSTQAGAAPAGELRTLAGPTNGIERRVVQLIPAAGETTAWLNMYAPQGTTYWSDVVVFQGTIAQYDAITGRSDAVLGGALVDVTASPRAILAPSARRWGTHSVAARLAASRDTGRPLRVTIFGDSIAESTAPDSWMKLVSDTSSNDPTLHLGRVAPYSPAPADFVNRAIGGSTSKLLAAHLGVARPLIESTNYFGMYLGQSGRVPPRLRECDLAILCVGQNGGAENNAMVDTCARLLRSAGVDVLLVATNPMNPAAENQGADRALAYRRIADAYDCGLADLNTEFRLLAAKAAAGRAGGYPLTDDGTGTVGLISDSVHPSALGKKVYARVIRAAMLAATPGARMLPPDMAVPPTASVRPYWTHQPRAEFNLPIVGAVTREAFSGNANPRNGLADTTQAANGVYVLPATTGWTDYVKVGSDRYNGLTLIVLGNGADQSFTVGQQGGGTSLATVTLTNTISNRVMTAEALPFGTTWDDKALWIRSSTGGKLLGVLLHEPGVRIRDRNQVDGNIDGLRFPNGVWSLAPYRVFANLTNGQLWGTNSDGGAAEFDFEGTGAFMRLGAIGQAAGQYQVSVDGVNVGDVIEGYSPNPEPAYLTVTATGLPPGRHTMRVSTVGLNASVTASPGLQNSRRMIVAQIGTINDGPSGYL